MRPEVETASTEAVQQRLDGSVWTQCQSWYRKDGSGRVVGNWPGFMLEYVRAVEQVNAAEYELLAAGAVPAAAAADAAPAAS